MVRSHSKIDDLNPKRVQIYQALHAHRQHSSFRKMFVEDTHMYPVITHHKSHELCVTHARSTIPAHPRLPLLGNLSYSRRRHPPCRAWIGVNKSFPKPLRLSTLSQLCLHRWVFKSAVSNRSVLCLYVSWDHDTLSIHPDSRMAKGAEHLHHLVTGISRPLAHTIQPGWPTAYVRVI